MGCTHYYQKPISSQCIGSSESPCKTKLKQNLWAQKVMYTVFWDRRDILHVDFLTRGETMNVVCYCETLQKLRRAIQNKRRGMLSAGVLLLQDNARPHTIRRSTHFLQEFIWQVFKHPLYSSVLALRNFHLFLRLNKFLSGQCQRF